MTPGTALWLISVVILVAGVGVVAREVFLAWQKWKRRG